MYKNKIAVEVAQTIADGLKTKAVSISHVIRTEQTKNWFQELEKQIRDLNTIPKPSYENPALQQKIDAGAKGNTLNLRSSQLKDQDMELVAKELKVNTVRIESMMQVQLILSSKHRQWINSVLRSQTLSMRSWLMWWSSKLVSSNPSSSLECILQSID